MNSWRRGIVSYRYAEVNRSRKLCLVSLPWRKAWASATQADRRADIKVQLEFRPLYRLHALLPLHDIPERRCGDHDFLYYLMSIVLTDIVIFYITGEKILEMSSLQFQINKLCLRCSLAVLVGYGKVQLVLYREAPFGCNWYHLICSSCIKCIFLCLVAVSLVFNSLHFYPD